MKRCPRRGFSLLEVLLATAMLLGSVVVLMHIAHLGRMHSAAIADFAVAQLVCQTRMNEIVTGAVPPQATVGEPIAQLTDWTLSVEVGPVGRPGVVAVKVSATENGASEEFTTEGPQSVVPGRSFALVRWIRDPNRAGKSSRTGTSAVMRSPSAVARPNLEF